MSDWLLTPEFARLTDYVGVYALESMAAAFLWRRAQSLDLAAHMAARTDEPIKSLMEKLPAPEGRSIALIRLQGLLMKPQSSMGGTSTVQVRRDIRQAAADPDIAGIIIAVESPGGTVAGTDDLAKDVKAAGRSKPVWAAIEDLGASAAYWVASQTQRVTANSPTALVGSIGSYQVIYDTSGAAENEGVRTLVFKTGPLKGMGVDGSKVTDEQAAHAQSLVESIQTVFDAAVQKGRGLTDKQLTGVRHGGAVTATAALDEKLIDAVQPLSKTMAEFTAYLKTGRLPEGMAAVEEPLPIETKDEMPPAGVFPMRKRQTLPRLG